MNLFEDMPIFYWTTNPNDLQHLFFNIWTFIEKASNSFYWFLIIKGRNIINSILLNISSIIIMYKTFFFILIVIYLTKSSIISNQAYNNYNKAKDCPPKSSKT